ncbi:AaceriADL154Cp [[Ashbya] aceris (nom. inval.)]|nr:AaceriADL154Cp [[Ashbya] aceris (nom. inval.)]
MFSSFRLASRHATSVLRTFHTSTPTMLQAGDAIPKSIPGLHENSPGNSVDIGAEVASGKHLIVGVPAAFSPACSSSHVPGYIQHFDELKAKGFKQVLVTCVNDSFVTKAWAESLKVPSGVRIIADTQGAFASAGGFLFDGKQTFGNDRSVRYALVVEDGKVVRDFVEPDKTGLKVSAAENVLKEL